MGGIFALFGPQRCLHGIEVRFLLELAYVLLVANSLVAKPIGHLKEATIYFSYYRYLFRYDCREVSRGEGVTLTRVAAGYLRDRDCTLFSKFLFGFFAGVGVGQVRVKIFIQDLCGLFAEIAPFAPDRRKQMMVRGLKTLRRLPPFRPPIAPT